MSCVYVRVSVYLDVCTCVLNMIPRTHSSTLRCDIIYIFLYKVYVNRCVTCNI